MNYFTGTLHDPHAAADRLLVLLRAAPDAQFAPMAVIARALFGASFAAIRLLDQSTVWTKAATGIALPPQPREIALCHHVVMEDTPIIVPDARHDVRFAELESVASGGLRFYAGVPLHVQDPQSGERITVGTVCVGDGEPRVIDETLFAALIALAQLAETVLAAQIHADRAIDIAIDANAEAAVLARQERVFGHAERMAMIGSWRMTLPDRGIYWSPGVRRIHETPLDHTLPLEEALTFYPPAALATVNAAIEHTLETGEPFDIEVDFITATGRERRVRSIGELERRGSRDIAMTGVFQDVTDRFRLEQQLRQSAATDPLTGIANRAAFDAALDQAIDRAAQGVAPCTLVLLDLDRFKATNDAHGHLAGDDVLRAIGERLGAAWLTGSFAARLGGDEFALLLTDRAMCDDIDTLLPRLTTSLAQPVASGEHDLPCSATIGHAAFGPGIANARELIHAADTALYDAKRRRHAAAGWDRRAR